MLSKIVLSFKVAGIIGTKFSTLPGFSFVKPNRLLSLSTSSNLSFLRYATKMVVGGSPEIKKPPKLHQNCVSKDLPNPPSLFIVKKLSENAVLPSRASLPSTHYDLSSAAAVTVPARGKALVPTDLSIGIPEGTYALIVPRSDLAWKHSIHVGAGVVDGDYRGPVGVILFNHSNDSFEVKPSDQIAQLILQEIDMPEVLKVEKLSKNAVLPLRASPLAAGYDLSSTTAVTVPARGKALVPTGLSIGIPQGTYARIAPRSGLAWKHSIDVGGVIDAQYRGPVVVILFNYSDESFEVKAGDRVAQLILEKILKHEVLEVEKLSEDAVSPSRASPLSAGYDLSSVAAVTVPARGKALVPTGLSVAIPEGTYARIVPQSDLALKHLIHVVGGIFDVDCRGLGVILFNHSDKSFVVKAGDRIAQLILPKVVAPEVLEVNDLGSTRRGTGGFGSTGVSNMLQ